MIFAKGGKPKKKTEKTLEAQERRELKRLKVKFMSVVTITTLGIAIAMPCFQGNTNGGQKNGYLCFSYLQKNKIKSFCKISWITKSTA